MLNYLLKKIFIPSEPKSVKYLFISAELVNINNKKYTSINFLVKSSSIKDFRIGYVMLDGLCYGNKLDFLEKFIGKNVLIYVTTGRSAGIMNKRVIKSITYKNKVYELFDSL